MRSMRGKLDCEVGMGLDLRRDWGKEEEDWRRLTADAYDRSSQTTVISFASGEISLV